MYYPIVSDTSMTYPIILSRGSTWVVKHAISRSAR